MAISRHGINKSEAGPMLRASFEETVEVFLQAAMFGMSDELTGVTENIMLGQLARVGTGFVDLLLDDKKLHLAIEHSRSEEHTSELQSLMRISYAVFCLKKKNKTKKS